MSRRARPERENLSETLDRSLEQSRFVPFNRPYFSGKEFDYIREACVSAQLAGDHEFAKRCQAWLETHIGSKRAFLTPSCTASLEMAAILARLTPGDEVIMPSYTFVSTANAFVLRGAIPVFVDIRPDTLNIDEAQIEGAITPRTKAIVVVHYAGVGCDMDRIMEIARRRGLIVIEDAAQGICASYRGRPLGSFGQLSAFSFHETKNIHAGEGGALLVNDSFFSERAEIVRQKGTNRTQFLQGQADKYTWVDVGSSFLPSELVAAFLWAQMERAEEITRKRLAIWDRYYQGFEALEKRGVLRRPVVPAECTHNAHLFYLLLEGTPRARFLEEMKKKGIMVVFHYVPLHSSPAGLKYGRVGGPMAVTDRLSGTLVRVPLWLGVEHHVDRIIEAFDSILA